MAHRLEGKVALVSGGARGMGAAHARAVVREGGSVVVADVLVDEGEPLARELGDAARFVPLDVRDPDGWARAVARAEADFGSLNVLVNNAGILRRSSVQDMTLAEWDLVMGVNATGVMLGMQAAVPALRRAGGGSIVNISSTAGLQGYTGAFAYSASKWAVRGMTKSAAADLAPLGIRVNSIHPGHIRTAMAVGFDDVSEIHLQRAGEPDEIAALMVFLASDESSFSTGAEFVADGGETSAQRPGEHRPASSPVVTDS